MNDKEKLERQGRAPHEGMGVLSYVSLRVSLPVVSRLSWALWSFLRAPTHQVLSSSVVMSPQKRLLMDWGGPESIQTPRKGHDQS